MDLHKVNTKDTCFLLRADKKDDFQNQEMRLFKISVNFTIPQLSEDCFS